MTIKSFSLFVVFTKLTLDFRLVKHPQVLVPIDIEAHLWYSPRDSTAARFR